MHLILASIAGKFAHHLKTTITDKNLPSEAVFITTASNTYDDKPWMDDDIQMFIEAGITIKRFDFANKSTSDSAKLLLQTQTLIMGGGNPIYLLEVLQDKQLLDPLRQRINQGMLYIGSSAGAVIAGPDVELEIIFEDRPQAKLLKTYAGLNFCPVYPMPHWGNNKMQELYTRFTDAAYAKELPILSLTDDHALEIINHNAQLICST